MALDEAAGGLDYCYLTTKGRRTGGDHTVEIWFGLRGSTLYMLSGGRDRSDWVRNALKTPAVTVRIGDATYDGVARAVEAGTDEDAVARRLLVKKYAPRSGDLSNWGRTALPVAVELDVR